MADPSGFNNPRLGQAFGNVASIFAPPAAQDIYAYARAAEARQKTKQASDLWGMANDPNFDRKKFDQFGVASGLYAPSSSYFAVETKDTTDRRGQDIGSADRRFGIGVESSDRRRGQDLEHGDRRYHTDTTAKTAITTTGMKEYGDTTRKLLDPVSEGQTRFVPQSVADEWKLPAQQNGSVKLNQGQKVVTPDGREFQGNTKPLTEDELKAKILQGLPQATQEAVAAGNVPIETVIMDGKPTTQTRPQVIANGAPAAPKPGNVYNYSAPGGASGTATLGAGGNLVDTQTGQALPPGASVQAPSGVQSKDPLGATTANQTAANSKAAGLQVMSRALDAYKKALSENPGIVGIPGAVRGAAQNVVSVAQEFGQAFGNLSPDAKIAADQVAQVAQQLSANRDPAIAQLRVMQADLAYKWAQMQNPSGEVSRQAFERALETLSGGMLANNQSALEAVTAIEQALQREQAGVAALRNPGAQPGPPNAPGVQTIQTPSGTVTIRPRQ